MHMDDVERHECTVNSSELAGHARAEQRSKHTCFSLTVRTPQCPHCLGNCSQSKMEFLQKSIRRSIDLFNRGASGYSSSKKKSTKVGIHTDSCMNLFSEGFRIHTLVSPLNWLKSQQKSDASHKSRSVSTLHGYREVSLLPLFLVLPNSAAQPPDVHWQALSSACGCGPHPQPWCCHWARPAHLPMLGSSQVYTIPEIPTRSH